MPPAARLTDIAKVPADGHGCPACPHTAQGPIILGSPTVFINSLPAARYSDIGIHAVCCGPNMFQITAGSATCTINSLKAARLNDETTHCATSKGQIITASPDVIIGDSGGGGGGGGKSTGGGVGTSKIKAGDLAQAAQPEHKLNKEVAQVGDVTTVQGESSSDASTEEETPPTDSFSVSITDNFSGVELDDVRITADGSDISGDVKKSLSPDGQKLTLDFEFEEGEIADSAEVRIEADLPDGTSIARSWKYKP